MSMLIKANRKLDCLGLYCPEPILRTRIEIDKLTSGQILEVIADDPAAEEDIKSLVKRLGQRLLEVGKEGNQIRFLIEKMDFEDVMARLDSGESVFVTDKRRREPNPRSKIKDAKEPLYLTHI